MAIELKQGGRPTKRPSDDVLADMYRTHTARQIADEYGVTEATVRSWIARIRRKGVVQNERK